MSTSAEGIIEKIRKYKTMANLPPEDYSEEGGLADSFVLSLDADLKSTQLRKVFHHMKDLQREFSRDKSSFSRARIAVIMPTLAYGVGRRLIPQDFYNLMKVCFSAEKCSTFEDFDNAVNFLEAIMAYHKFHNPKA